MAALLHLVRLAVGHSEHIRRRCSNSKPSSEVALMIPAVVEVGIKYVLVLKVKLVP